MLTTCYIYLQISDFNKNATSVYQYIFGTTFEIIKVEIHSKIYTAWKNQIIHKNSSKK